MARKDKLDWFRFYADDWFIDTAAMTLEQQGAYARLLCVQWRDGFVPIEPSVLASILSITPARFGRHIWPAVENHFSKTRTGLRNMRLEKERTERDAVRVMNREKGRRSGAARRRKAKERKTLEREQRFAFGSRSVEPNANEIEIEKEKILNPRTTPDRIARARASTEVQIEGDEKLIEPPTDVLAKIGATVLGTHPERVEIKHRNTSAPDPDDAHGIFMRFIQPFHFDTASVLRWQGRITEQRRGVAVREIQRGTYRDGNGRECSWQDLSDESRHKVVLNVFNGMLR